MSKRVLGIIIAAISLAAITSILAANRPASPSTDERTVSTGTNQSVMTDTAPAKTYTLAEVATHNNENDCWTVIDGGVYDITSYIPRHPGGSEILRACGTDGSSLFNTRKTADGEEVGSGTPHSSSARTMLQRFQVGTLAE